MLKVGIALFLIIALAVAGGFAYLAFGNFPVPSAPVEKVLPDARFPK